jgi:hypothetical protein
LNYISLNFTDLSFDIIIPSIPGYGYSNSDLKNPYLSREQLNARLIAPSINLSQQH